MIDEKLIKQYETTLILPVNLSKTDFKKITNTTLDMIQKEQGKIIHQHQEVRHLAYPIRKNEQGLYQTFEFQAPPHLIEKLEIFFKRSENIFRFITIRLDKHGIAYNEAKRNPEKEEKKKAKEPKSASTDKTDKKPTKTKKASPEATPDAKEKKVVVPKVVEKPQAEKKATKAKETTSKPAPASKEAKPEKETKAKVKTESSSATEKTKRKPAPKKKEESDKN